MRTHINIVGQPDYAGVRLKKRRKIKEVIIKESAEISSIFPEDDGTFSIINSHGKLVEHEQLEAVGYFRLSGKPKILRSIARTNADQVGDNPWKKYDKIGFIDTNSASMGAERLFVCSSSILSWKDDARRFADLTPQDLFVGYCQNTANPERIGWLDFIHRVQTGNVLSATDKMLLIVDSEVGSLTSVNARTAPVYSNGYLPDRFTIAYATSDSGMESWINKEMKSRDRVASRAMAAIRRNSAFLDALKRADSLYLKDIFEEYQQD